jgi:hypothetical protein
MAWFPDRIDSHTLGVLVHEVNDVAGDDSHLYRATQRMQVGHHANVEVIVWPPAEGVVQSEFCRRVDHAWRSITGDFDALLAYAEAVVTEAIDFYWEIDGETPPTAHALLASSRLDMIKISADEGRGESEIQFNDSAPLIAGTDLIISLNANLEPVSAHFDG